MGLYNRNRKGLTSLYESHLYGWFDFRDPRQGPLSIKKEKKYQCFNLIK